MRRPLAVLSTLIALALCALLAATTCNGGGGDRGESTTGDGAAARADDAPAESAHRRRRARTEPARDGVTEIPPAAPDAPAAPSADVTWTVRCVDPDGRGVVGLTLDRSEPRAPSVRTDADGVASFTTPADVDHIALRCEGLAKGVVTLTEREATLTTLAPVPLRVRVVDDETGSPVRGARVAIVLDSGRRVDLDATGNGGFMPSAPIFAGRTTWMRVAVDAPAGHAAESGIGYSLKIPASRYAAEVLVPIALRREADLRIIVREPDGTRAQGATVQAAHVGDQWVGGETSEPSGADGVIRVKGVPFLRRHEVRIVVGKDGRNATVEGLRFGASPAPLSATVTLPADKTDDVSIGGGAGGSFSGRRPSGPRISEGEGRVEVLVRRRDGRLAPGARVFLNGQRETRADADARVVFDRLAAGGYSLMLDEPGLTWTRQALTVVETGVTSVELVEGAGRTVILTVTDAEGVPLPGASIRVERLGRERDLPFLDGDVQMLHFLSGPDGRLQLEHTPATHLMLEARYGSWVARVELQQDRRELSIVLGPK